MKLQLAVYSPFMEEEKPVAGWCKDTIEYVNNNRSRVIKSIRGMASSMNRKSLQIADVEDIFSEIVMYLYKCDDYNIYKAIERSSSGSAVSLEGYVNACIKFCVRRYLTTEYDMEKTKIRETRDIDGRELSIFDTISDGKSEEEFASVLIDLEQHCKICEHLRYKYGPDIFMIWYIRLLTLAEGMSELYKDILNILGISKKELNSIERKTYQDEMMISFANSISNYGVERAIEIIENYVYSANKIKELVLSYN